MLELDPTDLVAIQRLDHLYSEQGRWQDLLGILEREAELAADPDEVAGYRYRTAQLYESRLDDTARAVDIYRGILEAIPEHQASVDALTKILHGDREPLAAADVLEPLFTSLGDFARVVDVLEVQARRVEDPPRRVELLQRIAEVRETVLDDAAGAFDAMARAVREDPRAEDNLANFERLGGGLGAWDAVATVYDEASASLAEEPDRQAELLARAGQIHEVQRGDAESAIARYQRVLAIDPENGAALRSLDRLYEALERWSEDADVLRRQIALPDVSPDEGIELRHRLGVVLESRLGDVDGALAVWREILDVQGDHPPTVAALESLFDRGVRRAEVAAILDPIYRMGEEWEKLASLQARGLDLVTDPAARLEAMHGVAEIAEQQLQDPTTAFEWVGRALKEQPLDERTQGEVERLAQQTGAWAELTNVYADVVEAEGASDAVRVAIGKKLARVHEEELGDLASAEGAYQFVLEVSPLDPDALESLDRIYSAGAESEKLALILERRAQIAQDPDDKVEHLSRLARILHEDLNRLDDAVARYREIVEQVDARHRPSLDALESIYFNAERWPELYAVYQRKLDVADGDEEQADLYGRMGALAEQYLGRPDDAVQLYERVLSLRGEEADTLGAIAALHESAGRWQDLIDVLERQLAAELDPDRRVAVALRIAGVYLHRVGDTERAVEGYRRALDIEPASFDALRALASIYRAQQSWDDLVATHQTLISLGAGVLGDDELKAAYAELGQIYWHTLQQGYEAVDAWRHVLDIDPGELTAIEALLAIHVAQEEWRDVVDVLDRKAAAAQTPAEKIEIRLQAAGVWEQRLGDPDGARPQWEAILEVDPLHDQAFSALEALHRDNARWDDLASLYVARHDQLVEAGRAAEAVPFMVAAADVFDQRLGDREQAFAAAQIAFDEDVANEGAVATLQRLTTATGKWNEVLKSTYDAYEAEPAGPRKTELGLHVARWYGLEHDRPDWAIPIYTKILAGEPDNVKALRALGELYRKTQQWQPLAKTLQRAVDAARLPEDRRQGHLALGEVYERHLNAPDAAVEQYDAALAVDPRDTAALSSLARVWQAAGEWPRVVDALRRQADATEDPAEVTALRLRVGEVLEDRVGDLEGAAEEFNGVSQADPTNLDALRGLERLYAKMGRSPELLRVLELQLEVVSTERERIKLLTRIGEMLEEEFVRPDQAIERFEQVVEIDPSNDNALRALERLYRNTSRWQDLVSTLERHLVATAERRDRVPIFLQMGRVFADELRDADHAEDAFLNVLQIDGQNTDALDALSRIYESRGDWHRALDVLEQLSSLLVDDPRRAVELRFRVGRIAEGSLQDEDRAIESYQSALDVDDGYQPALEALRTIHARREDWAMAARYLDREQSVTEQPRHRAKLLTELGHLYADPSRLDDLQQAVRVYEEALSADPDAEEAALPLVRYYVSEQRWADAEPLAEMLTRRAGRRDPAEQLEIQLTMGRVAAALGRSDRAIKAFTAAQALDRANVEAITALARAYYDKQDWENAFKHFQVLLVHHKDELDSEARADLYYRLGVVKREQSDRRRAINFFEKALEEFPGHRPTLDAMVETYAAGGEWEQSLAYRQQILDNELDEERRFAMLVEIGGLWQEKVKNPQKAIQAIAGASELKPSDHVLLHRLLGLYQETRQWSKVIDVVQRVSDIERDPVRKSKYAYTIASIYNQELKNPDEALTWYNTALDHNPQDPKPFVKINEVLNARRDWKNLERAYRKMLLRVAGKGDADLEFRLLHALGLIYRDRLAQNDNAIRTFEMASNVKPDDVTENKILAELYTRENRVPDAVERWQRNIAADVGDVEALHAVFDLYYQSRQYDKAWCVGATTTFVLRERAREDVRTFFEQYRPRRPLAPTGRLTEEHWVKMLFHPNEDPVVGKIFASILQPLRKAKTQPLANFGFTQAELQNPQTSSVALVKSLASSAQALNLPLPHVFLRPTQQGGLGFVPSEPIASVSGSGLLSGLTPQDLAFVAGKHLAYYRNEHYVRTLFPTTQELTAILLAAIKLVKPDQDVPPEALSTAQQLAPLVAQDPVASEGLRKVVRIFLEQGGQSNIKRWYQSVELTAARA
ncbi:MAG: tetratricopeptide repeat protein [Polyangiales bacterium]